MINHHYRKSHATGWNVIYKMSTVIYHAKYHLNYKIATDNFRLIRHTHNNLVGLVCHTTALTSTDIIIRSEHEKSDNNPTKSAKRVVGGFFSLSGNELNLKFLETFVDRGYWVYNVITMFVLAGSYVYYTIKRCGWFPFTYRQKLKDHDKRALIEEEKTCMLEKT